MTGRWKGTLILLRHGATAFNAEGRLQGGIDTPLGELGRAQAADAAVAIAETVGRPHVVISSPLARALDTAAAVAALAGVQVAADARLTQRSYGEWEGLTWDEVRATWPAEYERRMRGLDPAIGGWETSADVAARVTAALRDAAASAEEPADAVVVVVSHGGALQHGTLGLLGLPVESPVLGKLPHAHWNVMRQHHAGVWTLDAFALGAQPD